MKILITGGDGYIASTLKEHLSKNHSVITISRKDFDLTNSNDVNTFFENKYFDIVFHCAVIGGSRLRTDSYYEMDCNLKMYYNLHQLKETHFGKFITFGSGAELHSPNTPYGISKSVICKSISETDNFYNLRIFALFDKNELESRFIKANVKRYLKKEPMIIHQDKYMDFFYMRDFLSIIDYYIENHSCPKLINFSYENRSKLSDISKLINNLLIHKVDVVTENSELGVSYCGEYNLDSINLDLIGLEAGIQETFKNLLEIIE